MEGYPTKIIIFLQIIWINSQIFFIIYWLVFLFSYKLFQNNVKGCDFRLASLKTKPAVHPAAAAGYQQASLTYGWNPLNLQTKFPIRRQAGGFPANGQQVLPPDKPSQTRMKRKKEMFFQLVWMFKERDWQILQWLMNIVWLCCNNLIKLIEVL